MRWSRAYFLPVLAIFAIVAFCGVLRPPIFGVLSNFVFDSWQRIEPRKFERDGPVRIIAIDEASLEELGQWPWPRSRLAEAIRRLGELGVAGIGFDVIFNEPDRTSAESIVTTLSGELRDRLSAQLGGAETNDQAFAKAIADLPVVLAEVGIGIYRGSALAIAPGQWDLVLEGVAAGQRMFLSKNRVLLN